MSLTIVYVADRAALQSLKPRDLTNHYIFRSNAKQILTKIRLLGERAIELALASGDGPLNIFSVLRTLVVAPVPHNRRRSIRNRIASFPTRLVRYQRCSSAPPRPNRFLPREHEQTQAGMVWFSWRILQMPLRPERTPRSWKGRERRTTYDESFSSRSPVGCPTERTNQ